MSADYLPSQVVLIVPPLVDTMGSAKVEFAAAILVRACHALGDTWQPITWAQVQATLRADVEAAREPFASLVRNPFFRPDIRRLVANSYATREGAPVTDDDAHALTPKAFEAMRRWVRATKAVP